jgi:hypothetical protein
LFRSYNIYVVVVQMRELQMWCPAPLTEGELHRRKLRSEKYKRPARRLLELYESGSLVEADEDTNAEAGVDLGAVVAKSRRRTRSTVVKKSASAVATAISAVKAVEQKKKRKRRAASPPAVITPSISTPRSREVESEEEEEEKEKDEAIEELPVPEDQATRRPESPAARRQRELVQKTLEDALRRGFEAHLSAAATQAKIPAAIKPRVFWPKTRLPTVTR